MSKRPSISFSDFAAPEKGVSIVLVAKGGGFADEAAQAAGGAEKIKRIAEISGFTGALGKTAEAIETTSSGVDKIVLVGVGEPGKLGNDDWLKIGGAAFSRIGKAERATVTLALPETTIAGDEAADLALGMILRSYKFERYKTRKNNEENGDPKHAAKISICVADPHTAKRAFEVAEAVADGVIQARNLVNEPANILGPVEFAQEAEKLEKLGVKIEVLGEKEMKKLGMGALLGVAQGSVRPPRLVIMEWQGAKSKEKPVAFVGKGVVFDTGGISIKPAAGMEDMKGDMGGAAAVTGLMRALAGRKAKVNAIGIIGLVENMPDGNAQRPGDIVTSMSGQTIEVINTDAEGRLVLADALHYTNDRFKPRFIINLATLTGAVMVALGQYHAGLFSNDDELADQLYDAGQLTGEKLWRLPLGTEYDKMIDSKFADMKNSAGRYGGSITAAQFLKRFVGETAWAHLDVAGTAMGSPANEYSQTWASGYGVRLLDRLVRDHFES
ncbi:leucyl aminopeptidase [Brucella anthropi]|uniref:Probable cytosol aminopeptidase n=1 Tax=Brucella anthropi (strain ATCC 49188 / DSM 6882 / CCUG 24695 / JCM 21032 / LMG 3331 / NBRC 15819 / NCTC 12168 / Alc 37) TaxID=439375 RepID=AMPA_BRUA4|nr:leucyl aminopeptidase [Brucella anthropi]A6X259.1 RecName: Full=Probable cytosol aminopeptidase; AltName: Full=Leucine aminopeptidase; Short=LAP; AltName: Full=Leucyl aminopeptidase [Brucella anthropi ATCC 49188]ABS15313.1 Leucyl aminopeptidase [Brucella anthropi ATCC 49188]KAB2759724.1 leucyl aminopeptidase [Brucella anthropi]KAB2777154.1 leucyl aminopeptidase [Brucella anthropi]QQC24215.1 leucyl aminopeptidase [Brucella anthropi]UGQ21863.1 leucyl aminopeptidase [Brucella anthropi]